MPEERCGIKGVCGSASWLRAGGHGGVGGAVRPRLVLSSEKPTGKLSVCVQNGEKSRRGTASQGSVRGSSAGSFLASFPYLKRR